MDFNFEFDDIHLDAKIGGSEYKLKSPSFFIFSKIQKMAAKDSYDPDLVETYFKQVGLPKKVIEKLSLTDAGRLMGMIEQAFLSKKKLLKQK